MAIDIEVGISLESLTATSDKLKILILSTAGEKAFKTYATLEDVEGDYADTTKAYKKAKALFGQVNRFNSSSIGEVSIVGIATPTDPEDVTDALDAIRLINDDWYILLTDLTADNMIKAIAEWADGTGAGADKHPKLYFAKTANSSLDIKNQRAVICYCDTAKLDAEEIDAAWVGYCAPMYPTSINWKFKQPSGVSATTANETTKAALETANYNFMTTENKRSYMKNGVCTDGTYIDTLIGADYLTMAIRDNLYDVFLRNGKIPYTDDGFTVVVDAILRAFEEAAKYGIITVDVDSGAPVYNIATPKVSDATTTQLASRTMPDIKWEALQSGSVNGIKTTGVLRVTL